tara:strand:- start:156 stop:275 length:120 start_codon:yes stop_codon:yes gene_type:complete
MKSQELKNAVDRNFTPLFVVGTAVLLLASLSVLFIKFIG